MSLRDDWERIIRVSHHNYRFTLTRDFQFQTFSGNLGVYKKGLPLRGGIGKLGLLVNGRLIPWEYFE